jgi:3-oxoacyl-[acyl-carrier protein] reductase
MPEVVAAVTGTSRGIGKYIAQELLARGAWVFGCSRRAGTIEHERYQHIIGDVTAEADVVAFFAQVRRTAKALDVLINNAGTASLNAAVLTTTQSARGILDTNVLGTFLCCREAAKLMMRRRFGRIVNVTSIATPLKLEGEAVYAASKGAVVTLTQVLAREFGPLGVTVNAVGPTAIDTDLVRNVPSQKLEALRARQAIPRAGEMRDVMNVVEFFIRPESDFISGQVIYLGGIS